MFSLNSHCTYLELLASKKHKRRRQKQLNAAAKRWYTPATPPSFNKMADDVLFFVSLRDNISQDNYQMFNYGISFVEYVVFSFLFSQFSAFYLSYSVSSKLVLNFTGSALGNMFRCVDNSQSEAGLVLRL